MTRRAVTLITGFVVAAAVLTAQQPALKSGIDLKNLDTSVRAQDDFFKYVNGGWLARTEIPADKPSYSAGTEVSDKAETEVRAIIEEAAASKTKTPGSVAQQVGDLYASFIDEARADQLGAEPVQPTLKRIAALKSVQEMAVVAGELSMIGQIGPSGGYITADAKDPATPIVYLVQGGTGLPDRDYYLNPDPQSAEVRTKYQQYLTQSFTLANWPNAAADAAAVMALETELAKLQWTPVQSRDAVKTYNKIPLAKLSTEMAGFDWMAWAKAQGIDKSPNVIVQQPSFFTGFAAMVPKTPLGTWKAWLASQYLTSSAPYLNKPFVDNSFEFFGKTLSGQQAQRPRWKRGVSLVNGNLGEAVGRLYVDRHFPPMAKARMQKMIGNLIEAYRQSIGESEWMTKPTQQQALLKLSKITPKIGYPDKWRDYAGLVIKPNDLLGNVERAVRFENDFQVAKLGKPVDRGEWLMTPQTVNAYYNPLMNEIVFPAAILQAPFFNFEADDAVNYGGIGAVIGHELGHGFDDQGRRYDGTGMLRDWWTPADEQEFTKRAKMLVAEYNACEPLPGVHINGELTLGENIGDLSGLSIAYKAYKISLAGKPSPTIDGFTGEQRVFIGWGQVWRAKLRDEYVRQMVLTNPHSPHPFRASVPPSNIAGFYEAFSVKPGDKMYREPSARVKIW